MKAALLALLIFTGAAQADLSVTWVDAMTRVSRTEPQPLVQTLALQAARGEWEALQLVVTGPPAELRTLSLEATDITGPEGKTLPAPTLLREHYVRVSKSTPKSPLPAGDYPDALVPQSFAWQELPNEKSVNQPHWVDVHVPYTTPPGVYKGEVRVLGPGRLFLATRQYSVTVLPFDLPVIPRLRTSVMALWRRVAEVHGFDRQKEPPSPELLALLNEYYDLLAQHRLSIDQTYPTYPDGSTGKIHEATVEAGMRKQLLHRHVSTLSLPIWPEWPFRDPLEKDRKEAMAYVATWMKLMKKLHSESRAYVIMGALDEPNDAEAYARVRRWGDFFNEVEATHHLKIPLLITEQPTPDNAWWGRLDGNVDIWVPHFSQVWQDMESPNGKRDIARRIAAGEEVWCYAALVQMPEDWEVAHGNPPQLKASNPPVWCLDYPAMNHRVLAWVMPRHGITGFTYWDTLFASPGVDVWADAGTFHHTEDRVYNGDGSYIYPATQKQHGAHMPVASIRLKWLREMAEDYDYLMLAKDLGLEKQALEIAATFARGFGDWEDDMPKLYAARRKLAELISTKGGGQ
ncbi:glycoside hydrolase domain-containing protein [Prosthecobacter dejongeii]|uniref:Glycoside hydrolase 123 N-terminal domain-containing protein n=1 Tax=Prosthecobacter dejongeii TaxID=48465 RepID=A0A7W7YKD5_9BACT|nr:glycoside hydrolase domain-containing protein [Prosthecobacter dejongeii]MBB5037515.1 hypothetical protein [Prosthecobacter dejongeii]